jgi:ataxia telangiectasia mutated family protein
MVSVGHIAELPSRKSLSDKSYHGILEGLFSCTLLEKQSYFGAKIGSSKRLEKCAEALKVVVSHGASKVKRKTAKAIIDHITQVLPGPDGGFLEPLLQEYTKAFLALLAHPANVENFAAAGGDLWLSCIDFSITAVSSSLETADRALGSLPHGSPAPGTGQTLSVAYSTGRSGSGSAKSNARQAGNYVAENYLTSIKLLVSTPHAPVHQRAQEISSVALQILQARHLTLGTIPQIAFATINRIISHIQSENVSLAKAITRDLIPLLTRWWPPRAMSRDAMANAMRDEMLKTLCAISLLLESLMQETPQGALMQDIEELMDALWSEYSKREDRARFQLDDLTFSSMMLPGDQPRTTIFRMRPYNEVSEQNWALLESLAMLETLHISFSQRERGDRQRDTEQPRKRRRVAVDSNRIRHRITSLDRGTRLTALQLIPFLVKQNHFSVNEVAEMLEVLLGMITDKEAVVASWAMLACSRHVFVISAMSGSLANLSLQLSDNRTRPSRFSLQFMEASLADRLQVCQSARI